MINLTNPKLSDYMISVLTFLPIIGLYCIFNLISIMRQIIYKKTSFRGSTIALLMINSFGLLFQLMTLLTIYTFYAFIN